MFYVIFVSVFGGCETSGNLNTVCKFPNNQSYVVMYIIVRLS